jgi:hypothetical protein
MTTPARGEGEGAIIEAPARLADGEDAVGAVLRAAAPAFARPLPARAPRARARWSWLVPAAALAAGIVFVVSVRRPAEPVVPEPARTAVVAPEEARHEHATESHAPPAETAVPALPESPVARGTSPRRLPAGREVALDDGSLVRLDAAGAAVLRAPDPALTEVRLRRGAVHLQVTKRAPGQRLEVLAGGYVFRVVGTRFDVRLGASVARLDVAEGVVAVLADGREVRRVSAGESWSGAIAGTRDSDVGRDSAPEASSPPATESAAVEAPPALSPPPVPVPPASSAPRAVTPPAPAPRASDCLDEARRGPAVAPMATLACLQNVARTSGLDAEIALYEIARLRRDVLHDLPGALAALREHEQRFPRGGLRDDVLTADADLSARAGDTGGALSKSAALLAGAPSPDERAELHMLRGNVYSQQKHDCVSAAREYAEAARGPSVAISDEALFRRAVCLQQTGARDEAMAAFSSYLERTGASHAEQARARLQQLRMAP